MKKLRFFPALFLAFPLLFACQIPTAVEVRGTPQLRFSANMNIGSIFSKQLEQGFESSGSSIIPCVNTINFTYIIHEDLFNEELHFDDLPDTSQFGDIDFGIPLDGPKDLVNPDESIEIPLSGLGNFLEGLTFNSTKSILFVSGTDIVDKLCLGMTINDSPEREIDITDRVESGRASWGNEYTRQTAPSGGYEIDLPLDGSNVSVKYRVYAKAGETFQPKDFEDANIRVELVIWLPLEFAAGPNGAEIAFPMGSFFGESDLFGRDSPDAENVAADIIESLSMDIRLNTNPFMGKKLIIQSGENIEIKEQVTGDSLSFVFSEEKMELINDPANWPFVPEFKVAFAPGDTLKLPRLFNATELVFTAGIRFRVDLGSLPDVAGAF